MSSKEVKILTKKELDSFVNNLIKDKTYEVLGVKAKGERFAFGELDSADELRLDYDITILPPKKYFLPMYEEMMKFDLSKPFEVKENKDTSKRIIIGMHPYDIIALEQSDKVYLDSQEDDFYKNRRKNTVIIGCDMQNVSNRAFSASMNTHVTDSGFDLLLTNIGSHYAATIGSSKGKNILEKYADAKDAKESDIAKIKSSRENIEKKFKRKLKVDKDEWPAILAANYNNSVWEERSDKCMECSSCTMVCPTCYCYDVVDDVSLNLKDGQRIRTWDGCLLRDFTKIGSGEVFREDKKERYRHRFYRKGNYLSERYGYIACVGCGRCGIACIPDIADPCDVMNELNSFGKDEDTGKFFIKHPSKVEEKGTIHIPRSATIKKIKELTQDQTWFEIELDDKKPLNHKPGQFVEVSVFGIGEAPMSITSSPSSKPTFEIVVRKVGNVSTKLLSMKAGDKLGIRGPLGNGFDVKSMEGKNILFVSGGQGLVPMRSLINYVSAKENRKKYKELIFLYGCKCPSEVLFSDEIKTWKAIDNATCELTVDSCPEGECWDDNVGLITTLFPKIKLDAMDSLHTIAVVIGPPIMYKFVIKCLQTLGIPDENILVDLERRMKCGVGKCGHCQINGIYVCKEGPVFKYSEIKNLPEAFE